MWKKCRMICTMLILILIMAKVIFPFTNVSAVTAGDGAYTWPVSVEYGISNAYTVSHGGFDLGSPIGASVYAVADGTVILATDNGCLGSHGSVKTGSCSLGNSCRAVVNSGKSHGSYANWIIIDHGGGNYSLYAHLKTGSYSVSAGQTVRKGQQIACSGNAGNTRGNNGAHLHFELRCGGNSQRYSVDPKLYLTRINQDSIQSSLPVGRVDSLEGGIHQIRIQGWAYDEDDLNRGVEIQAYIGNTLIAYGTANEYRPDLNNSQEHKGVGEYHGYDICFNVSPDFAGLQTVRVIAVDQETGLGSTVLADQEVFISQDKEAPVISDVQVKDIDISGYTVSCIVTDNTSVKDVKFPTWTAPYQDDLMQDWTVRSECDGAKEGDTYTFRVSFDAHNGEHENYVTHIYAWDSYGNQSTYQMDEMDFNLPIGRVDSLEGGIHKIRIQGWAYDKDDLNRGVEIQAYIGNTLIAYGTANEYRPDLNNSQEHKGAGEYHGYDICFDVSPDFVGLQTVTVIAVDKETRWGNTVLADQEIYLEEDTEAPIITDVQVTDTDTTGYTISCVVTDNTGVKEVKFPTWTTPDQDDLLQDWAVNSEYNGTQEGSNFAFRVSLSDHNFESGTYITLIHAYDRYGNMAQYRFEQNVADAETYLVRFEANGGMGEMDDLTDCSGQIKLPECTFIPPDGMKFKLWQIDDNEYAVGDPFYVCQNTTIIAVWEEIMAAKIGDAMFSTLTAALEAAKGYENATIDLLYDISGEIVVSQSVTINKNEHAVKIQAGEGYELRESGDSITVSAVKTAYTFQQSTQLGLIEPWFLKSNLYVSANGTYMAEEELNALKDFGVYFVRASRLGKSVEMPSAEDIINDADTVLYSKNGTERKAKIEKGSVGYMITASYMDGIYTYELNDPVYVLYYIEDISGIHYDVVKTRNLLDMAAKAQSNASFDETERNVYTRMVELHNAITAHRETFASIPEMIGFAAPKVTAGMFGAYETGYTVNHSTNIILIEPWGIRLNGYVDGKAVLEDSGVVVFYDKDEKYKAVPSVEELVNNPEAYVLSASNGNATASTSGNYTKIVADFNKDIYTYQLNDNAYAVFFVKIGGVYHFGEVKTRNVLNSIEGLVNNASYSETERAVYRAMINMHEDVVTHRAKFTK